MGFLQPTISRIHIVLKLIINNILYRKLQVSHRSLRSYTQHVNLKYLLSKHLVVNTLHEEEWWRAMFNCRMLTGENADLFKAELFHVGSKRQRNMNTTFILQSNLWQTIFKWNEVRLYSATVCVCVYLDRVLEHCNRKYFGRHGTEKQAEVFVDWCVCTGTEMNIIHSHKQKTKNNLNNECLWLHRKTHI